MSFKSLCEKYFGCSDFYEILKISSDASEKEIKKAYHRLSLLVHPDRVSGEELKKIATEKFKALGKIHTILQNNEKRKVYDDCGEYDEESDNSDWTDYWQKVFKKIELKDIQDYEKQYVGSDTELRDIKRAYEGSRGNMDTILEMVPFSNCDSEPRIIEIVQKMVDNGEVESYNTFFNESKQRKIRRRKKWEREHSEFEKIDLEELEKELEKNRQEQESKFVSMISNLEAKYAPKKANRKSITDGNSSTKKRKRSKK